MAFATLIAAANGCLATMFTRYTAGTIKADLQAFATQITGTFSDDNPNDRTVGNWLVSIQAIASAFSGVFAIADDYTFQRSVEAVYRMCWQANDRSLGTPGANQISATQATAVLTAVNAHLA
jgi:hypothetical protein